MSQYDVPPDAKIGPPATVPPFELDVDTLAINNPPVRKLEAMLALLDDAKADADESAARFRDLKSDIKAEVTGLVPGRERIVINSRFLRAPWIVRSQESWVIDSKMLKAMDPFTWAKFAKKTQAWYLEAVKGKRS